MEVPFPDEMEREEEELVGMDLQKRRRSHQMMGKIHNHSPTSSESSITSDSSFEHSATMNAIYVDVVNGEKPKIVEDLSLNGEADSEIVAVADDKPEKEGIFEEPINRDSGIHLGENENENENENGRKYLSKHEGTNGFSVHQNGAGVADSSPEIDGEEEEVHVRSNGTTFSKGPDNAIGLRYVESLLDESSSSINGKPSDIPTTEQNVVNKILKRGQNELGPEAAEYDVEGVILKQETHDLYCPNCNSCITKRVILRRRKRKIQDISTGEEVISSSPGQISAGPDRDLDEIVETSSENEIHQDVGAPDAPVNAVTCFSCLSIFIPTGEGFLFWRKTDIVLQPDRTLAESPPDVPHQAEPSLSKVVEPPSGNTFADAPKDEGIGKLFPMWILTCCQPYGDERKTGQQVEPGTPVPPEPESPTPPDADGLSTKPPLDIPHPTEDVPAVKAWADAPKDEDMPLPPDPVPDIPHDDGTLVPPESKPVVTSAIDTSVPPKPNEETPLPPDPKPAITPDDDTLPPPEPKLLVTPDPGNRVTLPMPEHPTKSSKLPVISPDDTPPRTEPLLDIEAPLLEPSPEHPRSGVSGLDIIKAVVYGGLLESIASLSIIAAAAGGDATTLNIVALGLANVFGGLIVLFHNLRVLKNEHTTQHYEEQLGKPGHFLLHATIAAISYLVFGLMAPVVYGFSFRKSDDKNLKLITLAAASLVCIMILSIGKAYVRRPPKDYIRIVFYYTSIGVMVSGLGYVAGELINDALKKLGVFDSRSIVNIPVLEAGTVKAGLSSY